MLAAGFGLLCAELARCEAMTALKQAVTLCMEYVGLG